LTAHLLADTATNLEKERLKFLHPLLDSSPTDGKYLTTDQAIEP